MTNQLKLLCMVAHPDDESMAFGGTLAKYAAEGVETHVICATRGERGWMGKPEDNPGLEGLGKLREVELQAAVDLLGVHQLHFLDYIDGDLDRIDSAEATTKIARLIRAIQPQVVVTFGPEGLYGHPDHIAISQLTSAAAVQAAAEGNGQSAYTVSKFYFIAYTATLTRLFYDAYGQFAMNIDGVDRKIMAWPDWAISTQIHAEDYGELTWRAVACHQTQLPNYARMNALPPQHHRDLWGVQNYYRVYSLVNGGREMENDLFQGLR